MRCPNEGTPNGISQPDDAREDAETSQQMGEEEMYERVARIFARGALRKAEADIRKRKEAEGKQ
jgi:hypothetical protein